ncbi:hypothetical protein A0J61_05194 [Choanephora cucurbitarum]|uniref:Uncharacterized protein n=1 Tax=Choanephora cucurbitarum TaxID=101091 RepID=A0A1C7NCC6_9FUNG|nr:hypothetical protein A0J61_05194 [Choanephora cucurbitarum]
MSDIQERFIQLVKQITQLQWVRESLPAHSKYHEGLKKKLEKQIRLKEFSEKELKKVQAEKDHYGSTIKRSLFSSSNSGSATKSYSNTIESVRLCENTIQQLESRIEQAKLMMEDLNKEKAKLDSLCHQLHELYDEIILPDAEDTAYAFEQHLKKDVEQLAQSLPDIKQKIDIYTQVQSKLYKARDLIETAMKSLPGASAFMDRQAIAASHNSSSSNSNGNNLFSKSSIISSTMDPIKNAEKIAQSAYTLVTEACEICQDVPNIPIECNDHANVISILTNYRGYRLKIEYTLRTQVNPRLHGFENQLASTKFHYEQRLIEWIDYQIVTLEAYLKTNGCTIDIDREISQLRVGSRAAIAAVASEASGRVTVDDVLDIQPVSDIGATLPEYEEQPQSTSSSDRNSLSSHSLGNSTPPFAHIPQLTQQHTMLCDPSSMVGLPSYASEHIELSPPAYSQ